MSAMCVECGVNPSMSGGYDDLCRFCYADEQHANCEFCHGDECTRECEENE
jgi:hypothetical protein